MREPIVALAAGGRHGLVDLGRRDHDSTAKQINNQKTAFRLRLVRLRDRVVPDISAGCTRPAALPWTRQAGLTSAVLVAADAAGVGGLGH